VTVPQGVLDAALAAGLAEEAGRLLLALRENSGLSGKELGQRGDHESNELLLRELARERPGDAVLSEESVDSPVRLAADRVWIIDPLDGTREYGMPGRDDWAVHVALWERGAGITAAAVAQPSLNVVYDTDEAVAPRRNPDRLRFLVSDSRPPAWAPAVAAALGAELAPMGSAGAKAMAVVRNDAQA
jgi:3'-phosphoadenosine 5'-phosphosulfate (PAPS) 3'-phosphatase